MVQSMLDQGADVDDFCKEEGHTALRITASNGNVEVMKLLLERGALLHSKTRKGQHALHIAAEYGQVDTVLLLISKGFDVGAVGGTSETALHVASKNAQRNVIKALLVNKARHNVATRDKYRYRPLHLAIMYGGRPTVATLIKHAILFLDARDGSGATSLHLACEIGDSYIVGLLLNLNSYSSFETARHIRWHPTRYIRERFDYYEMDRMPFLLRGGADVTVTTHEGNTALHIAASHGYTDICHLLL